MRIIFLDIDGVLNCQLHYHSDQFQTYLKSPKDPNRDKIEYYRSQICQERLGWLNELCEQIDAKVVISSTWRRGKSLEELQELFKDLGATFQIIGKTPVLPGYCVRGNEIVQFIESFPALTAENSYDYKDYVIIDDDSDMLLNQAPHFFQTDTYSGLTPNVCYRIKRFFGGNYFGE